MKTERLTDKILMSRPVTIMAMSAFFAMAAALYVAGVVGRYSLSPRTKERLAGAAQAAAIIVAGLVFTAATLPIMVPRTTQGITAVTRGKEAIKLAKLAGITKRHLDSVAYFYVAGWEKDAHAFILRTGREGMIETVKTLMDRHGLTYRGAGRPRFHESLTRNREWPQVSDNSIMKYCKDDCSETDTMIWVDHKNFTVYFYDYTPEKGLL